MTAVYNYKKREEQILARKDNNARTFLYNSPAVSILDSIRAHQVPVDMLEMLDQANVPFYDGCLIVEEHDHSLATGEATPSDPSTLWADISILNARNGNTWTDQQAIEFEAKILAAIAPPLCLDPDPIASKIASVAMNSTSLHSPKRKPSSMENDKRDDTHLRQITWLEQNRRGERPSTPPGQSPGSRASVAPTPTPPPGSASGLPESIDDSSNRRGQEETGPAGPAQHSISMEPSPAINVSSLPPHTTNGQVSAIDSPQSIQASPNPALGKKEDMQPTLGIGIPPPASHSPAPTGQQTSWSATEPCATWIHRYSASPAPTPTTANGQPTQQYPGQLQHSYGPLGLNIANGMVFNNGTGAPAYNAVPGMQQAQMSNIHTNMFAQNQQQAANQAGSPHPHPPSRPASQASIPMRNSPHQPQPMALGGNAAPNLQTPSKMQRMGYPGAQNMMQYPGFTMQMPAQTWQMGQMPMGVGRGQQLQQQLAAAAAMQRRGAMQAPPNPRDDRNLTSAFLFFLHNDVTKKSTLSHDDVALQLRNLMRSSAQPVTVMTTRLDDNEKTFHGAVLSSFTSVALHPFPLVAFAIRKPSRMADALHANRLAQPSSMHGIINILSEHQSEISKIFSRPDLYPHPFDSISYGIHEGTSILEETIGALSCSVITSLPMTSEVLSTFGLSLAKSDETIDLSSLSSELFLARVIQVLSPQGNPSPPRKPLVYYQGSYTSIL
ncbi:Flavin reductase like domain [Rhizoctonia solani]|uniref:Flavin reductase like domain n=1 Tax=Rhizoctonia solani TaxID=456999 RepID=A0A8H7M6Y3_9AGAM|nr:Flavin reductase like domain [Rhizoctonia solani]